MAPTVIERTTELRRLVASLAELRDGLGVLSITIGIEPGAVSGGTPCGWGAERLATSLLSRRRVTRFPRSSHST